MYKKNPPDTLRAFFFIEVHFFFFTLTTFFVALTSKTTHSLDSYNETTYMYM